MSIAPQLLLLGAVVAVGVLHTIVPDHWVPLALIARQRGWSRAETVRAAIQAGSGHVLSTLLIGLVVWLGGIAFAARFGAWIEAASSLALVAFGLWIALSALRELLPALGRAPGHGHSRAGHGHDHHGHDHHGHDHHGHGHHRDAAAVGEHDDAHGDEPASDPLYAPLRSDAALLTRHRHAHRHGSGSQHVHWHDHEPATAHAVAGTPATPGMPDSAPLHVHRHKTSSRTALLLILGSSPMVEGIPAFFAAARYGAGLLAAMALLFAASTIATYVVLCVASAAGLQRLRLGAVERYGEVLSGAFISAVGVAFWIWPAA